MHISTEQEQQACLQQAAPDEAAQNVASANVGREDAI